MRYVDPHIIRRGEALQRGAADHQLQRQCRTGTWHRLRPGRYTPANEFDALDTYDRHRLRAVETLRAASADAVLSHQSAAVIHGLDLWNTPLAVAHLTRNRPTGGRRTRHRHVHTAALHLDETAEVAGLRMTTLARTVVDLARTLPFEQAVVAGDHALHSTTLTSEELSTAADRLAPHAGRRRVHRVLAQLDGRAESVGESRSRVLLIRAQFALPDCQPDLFAPDGTHVGRVDFLFEEHGVVGEFDGDVKYTKHVPTGMTAADVVVAEKKREDRIRGAGWQVARWTWDDLENPRTVIDRLTEQFDVARLRPPPRGRVVHRPRP